MHRSNDRLEFSALADTELVSHARESCGSPIEIMFHSDQGSTQEYHQIYHGVLQ